MRHSNPHYPKWIRVPLLAPFLADCDTDSAVLVTCTVSNTNKNTYSNSEGKMMNGFGLSSYALNPVEIQRLQGREKHHYYITNPEVES